MSVTYKKLWKLLIDKNMKKKELASKAHLTQYALNKLSRDENVTTEILGRICDALDCSVEDIIKFYPDKE